MSSLFRQNKITTSCAAFLCLLFVAFGVSLFGASAVYAQGNGDRVMIGNDLTIDKGEEVTGNVSVTNGDLTLLGAVDGKVVVVGGDADIEGAVKGDVTVTNGNVTLGPTSNVVGNVLVVWGTVSQDRGAKVGGKVSAPDLPPVDANLQATLQNNASSFADSHSPFSNPMSLFGRFVIWGMLSLITLMLAVGVALVVPSRVIIANATLNAEPGPSIVVGLITAVLLPPAMAALSFVLLITFVGVVLIPVLAIAAGLALLFGLVVSSIWLGRRIYETTHQGTHGMPPLILEMLLGMAVLLGSATLPGIFLSPFVGIVLMMLVYFAACIGVGSAILSRLGTLAPPKHTRPYGSTPWNAPYLPTTPAPPRAPQEPAVTAPLGPAPGFTRDQQP